MQVHAIILAATDSSGSANLPLIVALVAAVIALIALVRVSSLSHTQTASNPQPAPLPAPAVKAAPPAASIAPAANAIPPEILAVIAAAVATVTGNRPIRIVSIKPMSTSWERAGRQSVLTSHRIR